MLQGERGCNLVMKIMISGGGTGGHIYPAIAIARKIKDFEKDSKIIWIGTRRKLEKELISKTDFGYETIKSRGFSSNFILDKFYSLILLSIGFFQSIFLILKHKPDIILGMGGYACAPTVIAGFILRKKTAIFEPNVILGRANRFLKKWVDLILVSHKQTLNETSDNKSNYIGNIVKEELKNTPSKKWGRQYFDLEPDKKTVLIFGGSQGSVAINNIILNVIFNLCGGIDVQFLHITGIRNYKVVKKRFLRIFKNEKVSNYKILPYVHDMHFAYAASNLIISRAGANTIAEIICLGIPSILIPFPYATDDHQLKNAKILGDIGAAIVIPENELNINELTDLIFSLIKDEKRLKKMGKLSKNLHQPKAVENMAKALIKLSEK